jgi:SNF2 family DNA or RNA helicase|tara:strand:- start:9523 stop:10962 length:1440 start_codon:yes stop_codon:yes gene_type:complete
MNYRFKTKPFQHQLEALEKSWNKEVWALFMEMGTGKTKVCIDNIAILYDKGKINSAIIIVPNGIKRNWRNELKIHLPDHINYRVAVWSASPKKEEKKELDQLSVITDDLTIFIINIEALSTTRGFEFARSFLLRNASLACVDESTTIKNHNAKRTKNILKLRDLAKYKRIMTGSPVTKSPLDLFSQIQFLDPYLIDQQSYYSFRARYAVIVQRSVGTHSFQHIIRYQRLDELQEKIQHFSTRVLKSECLDLPPKLYTKRVVSMTPEQLKAYVEMKKSALTFLEDNKMMTAATVLTQLIRLHQITCGHVKTDDGEIKAIKNNRIQELLNVLEETRGKVIIWAVYRHDIQEIEKVIGEIYGKESVATYYGDTKDSDRQHIVDRFQSSGDNLRFFVGNPKTGGYGLTLTSSHTVVYFSNDYSLEVRMQSEDRAHRIGQTSKVTYVDLMAEHTIDEKIVKALNAKIDLASQVMGEDPKKILFS